MPELGGLGKSLIVAGGLIVLLGVAVLLVERGSGAGGPLNDWFGWFGKLPGDISIKRDGFSFYFPLATSVLISVVLSLLVYFLSKR